MSPWVVVVDDGNAVDVTVHPDQEAATTSTLEFGRDILRGEPTGNESSVNEEMEKALDSADVDEAIRCLDDRGFRVRILQARWEPDTKLTVSWSNTRFERPTPELESLPDDEYGTTKLVRELDHIGYLHRSVGGINPDDRRNLVRNLRAVRDLAATLVAQVEARIADNDSFPYVGDNMTETLDTFRSLVRKAHKAAYGDSGDGEIEALQATMHEACRLLGVDEDAIRAEIDEGEA